MKARKSSTSLKVFLSVEESVVFPGSCVTHCNDCNTMQSIDPSWRGLQDAAPRRERGGRLAGHEPAGAAGVATRQQPEPLRAAAAGAGPQQPRRGPRHGHGKRTQLTNIQL